MVPTTVFNPPHLKPRQVSPIAVRIDQKFGVGILVSFGECVEKYRGWIGPAEYVDIDCGVQPVLLGADLDDNFVDCDPRRCSYPQKPQLLMGYTRASLT